METHPDIMELEIKALKARLVMRDVLAEAGVNVSTWHRWRRRGMDPKLSTLRRVAAAIDAAVAERTA